MAFDYKKEYKEFYLPPQKPAVVRVPPMNYVAVRGQGNPNDENGEYKRAIGILYAVSYTLKMSKLGKHKLEGYFDYVVPPLEGLWRMNAFRLRPQGRPLLDLDDTLARFCQKSRL